MWFVYWLLGIVTFGLLFWLAHAVERWERWN